MDKIHFRRSYLQRQWYSSPVVVSNCYQLAWILAVSRVASWGLAIDAVKVIWVSSDDKTGESEVIWEITFAMYLYLLSANSNALLTCLFLWILWRSLDFSEQDFILETVMRSYSRRQDFTTEPNAPKLIYLARWNTKTNKQRRTAPFLSIHLWLGHVTNGYCNIQWMQLKNSVYKNNKWRKQTFKCTR